MPRSISIAAAICLLALAGCSSLSKSQCLAGDWQTVGYRDGASGVSSAALLRHENACVKLGVIPDRKAYLAGWQQGVAQYCQPSNGFGVGERGGAFSNVCPAGMQDAFHEAYQQGRQLYLARSEIANLQHGIDQREQRLREVKSSMAAIAAGLIDSESTTAERAQMLINAKDLAEEQGRLNSEIDDLKARMAVKSRELDALQQSLASAG